MSSFDAYYFYICILEFTINIHHLYLLNNLADYLYICTIIFIFNKKRIMATTLKITPTLKGRESKKFNQVISTSRTSKISDERKAKMFALVSRVMAKKA